MGKGFPSPYLCGGFNMLKDGDVVLFQGDSITDYMRKREEPYDLGNGYPLFVSALWKI